MGEAEGEGGVCLPLLNNGYMEICKSPRTELKRDHDWIVVDGAKTEPCAKKLAKRTPDGAECEPSYSNGVNSVESELCGTNRAQLEPCAKKLGKRNPDGAECEPSYSNGVNSVESELCGTNRAQLEPCVNDSIVKEASNDDPCSEVSNPILSPRENASSFQTISSQPVELAGNNQSGSAEITSPSSDNSSSTEETLSADEQTRCNTSSTGLTTQFVLEIPKHASTTGVRKIKFKFSKHKEDYGNKLSVSVIEPVNNGFDGCYHEMPQWNCTSDVLNAKLNFNALLTGSDESNDHLTSPLNMQVKIPRKVAPDSCPTNVKKLLSTRILEGARVTYVSISAQRELHGIIKDCGYLCGCSMCNYSKVLSAFEFELHAGVKTRHPNNHIYLENGKPIYSIIQELKTVPLSKLDEVVKNIAGSSVNEEFLLLWKANLQQISEFVQADTNCHATPSAIYDSVTSQPMDDSHSSACGSHVQSMVLKHRSCLMETAEQRKRVIKKPRYHFTSSMVEHKRTAEGSTKKRDNDLHRLLFIPNGLPDRTDLAYYSKGKKILGGYKQGNGIVCSCCDSEISPSQFEAHAGWSVKRQPYRHIYTSNGLTLHDIALLLANGHNLSTLNSDDMCTICGNGGELIICDGCPHAFHSACLGLQSLPTGDWHCPRCRVKFVPGKKVVGDSRPIILRMTRVGKAPESESGGCVVCRAPDFSVAKFDERTVLLCDQCEKEYHVGCLRKTGLCDLKELPKDKWFCCDDCNIIHSSLQKQIFIGAEAIPVSVSNAITRKHAEKGLTGLADDMQWQILSCKSHLPHQLPLLSRVAAMFRECFDPIVAKSGRDLIPVMVYGRNICGQEFGGMYCVVLIVKSVVVSAGLLRILGLDAAELPLIATSRENRGKGYFQALFSCIEMLLHSMNVQNVVLPAAEDAESIWTKKLGFQKMNDERLSKYTRNLQLTMFKGTSMLEKEVQRVAG